MHVLPYTSSDWQSQIVDPLADMFTGLCVAMVTAPAGEGA